MKQILSVIPRKGASAEMAKLLERILKYQLIDRYIRRVDGGWKVFSEKGKSLGGPYDSREKAEKRLGQVEMFKHMKGKRKRK